MTERTQATTPVAAPPGAPPSVVALTVGLAVSAVALAAVANVVGSPSSADRWAAVPLFGLLVIAGTLRVRYYHRGQAEAVDVLEAVLAPALLLFPAALVVVMVAAAKAVSQVILRIQPIKAAFNVAQWAAAAAAGGVVVAVVGPSGPLSRRLAGLAAALVVVMIVNHAAVVMVLGLVGRQSFAQVVRGLAPMIVAGWLGAGLLNLAFGLLLAAASTASPWLTPLALAPLAALYLAGGHLLVARLDRDRRGCFQRARHAFADVGDPRSALDQFLLAVAECFSASGAELLIEDAERVEIHGVGPAPQRRYSYQRYQTPVDGLGAQLLTLPDAAFVAARTGQDGLAGRLAAAGRRQCLAAPARFGAERRGVLCVYDPQAVSERVEADLTTLKLLAGEAVQAFRRGALDDAVVDENRRVAQLLAGQAEVFESVARGGNMASTLRALAGLLEQAVPGGRSTIALDAIPGEASPVPAPLVVGSGPSPLPDDALRAARDARRPDGGAATFVVEDMHHAGYSDHVAAWYGLRAWWALPVLHPQHDSAVGVVSVAHPQARSPEPPERELLAGAARLARLALDRALSEARLTREARSDSLTGLANREAFLHAAERALARRQPAALRVLVLFIDLDRFKFVNDSFGHELGDRLLVEVARRVESVVRPTDLTARIGGDEFAVLCQDLSEDDGLTVAARVVAALDAPFSIAGAEALVTASIGVASTTGNISSQTLIERADAAMYRAKERGRNCIEVFDEDMRHETRERVAIRMSLHRALERREMRVHYQPMVSLVTGHTVGVEALARWRQPGGELVGPATFIEAAEESGLIIPLGARVLEEACWQAARWRDAGIGPLTVSVNLSARQVADRSVVHEVARVLGETGFDPPSLILEITESVLMEAAESTTTLQRLKGLGVGLAIDDFGTGYSSLSYLKRFPVDSLKVDRSFVGGLGNNAEDTAIVAAVINLAHTLGLGVVAEGVETGEQLRNLRELGCEVAQGYHLGRPVAAEHLLLQH